MTELSQRQNQRVCTVPLEILRAWRKLSENSLSISISE